MTSIPFGVQAYQHPHLEISAQTMVNFYPSLQPQSAKSRLPLVGCPGLKLFAVAGNGPIRGTHRMSGLMYAVSDKDLYSVSSTGVATLLKAGLISGSNQVGMATNGTQLAIVNGSNLYVYTVAGGLGQVTDPDFMGANTCYFQNQRLILDGDGGKWQLSDLTDFTSFDNINIATAESAPDDTIAVLADHGEMWLGGDDSIEVWSDVSASPFPYARSPGGVMEVGIGARYSFAKLNNTVFWLGSDGSVYKADSLTPVPISTEAIEAEFQRYSSTDDAIGWVQNDRRHQFYFLTFPSANATWVYDNAANLWHQRARYDASMPTIKPRHRANNYCYCYGRHLVGDFENGNIYELDYNTYTDNGTLIRAEVTSPPLHAEGQWQTWNHVQIDLITGAGLPTGQGSAPLGYLSWSDDGGNTFEPDIGMPLGAAGKKLRADWWDLGQSENGRSFRYWMTDPIRRAIVGANADVETDRA